jgi:hypothetical protein
MFFQNKKGVIEAQFNWIFILVVGAIILLFFVSLVSNQKKSADVTVSTKLLGNLESIAKGAALSVGTVYDIDMPPGQVLENNCEDEYLTFYESPLQGINLKYNVLFSPKILSGSKLYTYSLYWQAPFVVTPLLYMTTDNVLCLVVENEIVSDADVKIYEEIPVREDDNLKVLINIAELKEILNTNLDAYTDLKIIFVGNFDESIFDGVSNSKARVSVYDIFDSGSGDMDFGNFFLVKMYEYDGDSLKGPNTASLFGFPLLIGVLFSESVADFECNVYKSLLRYELISEIYEEKVISLKNYTQNNRDIFSPNCLNFYSNDAYADMNSNINSIIETHEFENSLRSISNSVNILKQNNINLGDSSCPIPY